MALDYPRFNKRFNKLITCMFAKKTYYMHPWHQTRWNIYQGFEIDANAQQGYRTEPTQTKEKNKLSFVVIKPCYRRRHPKRE